MPYCFIVDDTEFMGDKDFERPFSAIEICKAAVEQFQSSIKVAPTADKHMMLFHTGPDRSSILAMYADPPAVFESAIKNLEATTEERDVAYAIALAFVTINKYRMINGTDRFGDGRLTSVIEPTNVIFLTTGKSVEGKQILFPKGNIAAASDLYFEPFRWDQKFFTFLIVPKGETKKVEPPLELKALAEATGGEVIICRGLKDTLDNVKSFVKKSLIPSVVVKIMHEHPPKSDIVINVKLAIKSPSEWPIPEAFWVDKNVDNLPLRTAHPILRIERSPTNCSAEIALLRELDIAHDTYELALAPTSIEEIANKGSDILRILGLGKEERCFVYVKGSHRLDGNSTDPTSLRQPCGILGPSRIPGISAELMILPMAFPKLLAILKAATIQRHALSPSVRQEFALYLWCTAGYYYPALAALLKRMGLSHLGAVPESGIFGKGVSKRLSRLHDVAHSDISNLETKNMERWPTVPVDPVALVTATLSDPRNNGARALLAKGPRDVPTQDLLGTWEQLRKCIYGGDGLTVRGLSLAPPLTSYTLSRRELDPSTPLKRCVQPPSLLFESLTSERKKKLAQVPITPQQEALEHDWFFKACGGSRVVTLPVSFMGNYAAVLAKIECPRDPTSLDPPVDEGTTTGVLRRKLTINFGSPYQKKFNRKKSSEVDIDEGATMDDIRNIFADSPLPQRDVEQMSLPSYDIDLKTNISVIAEKSIPPLTPKKRPRIIFDPNSNETPPTGRGIAESALRTSPTNVPIDECIPSAKYSRTFDTSVSDSNSSGEMKVNSNVALEMPGSSTPTSYLSEGNIQSEDVESELPIGWVKQYSNSKKREYWFNTETGESSWERPT